MIFFRKVVILQLLLKMRVLFLAHRIKKTKSNLKTTTPMVSLRFFFKKKTDTPRVCNEEVVLFYKMLLKMRKRHPNLNVKKIMRKLYPNFNIEKIDI